MCGIAGFSRSGAEFTAEREKWNHILEEMNRVQKHRGPDDQGIYLADGCGLAHVRLSIIDLDTGHQPIIRTRHENTCAIVYNGEVYNMKELKRELEQEGAEFQTASDTEVVLTGYMMHGPEYVKRLNGIFAFAIWDARKETLYLFRDRLGVKPLFYARREQGLVFSSELKGLFQYPGIEAEIDKEGLCEIFGLGPARTNGVGVFRGIEEVLQGHYLEFDRRGMRDITYWQLDSHPHTDSYEQTVEKTSWLLQDAVRRQMLSDIPVSTFLSGGIDSSLVTAICAEELQKDGKKLNTFSFDFKDNDKNFKASDFQPSQDRPWVDRMVAYSDTNHHYLECDNKELIDRLYKAVDARDLPCMGDVESSLLYFCEQVVPHNKVTLTGECADEIFGGYPWFHKKEMFETNAFPWSMDISRRKVLLADDLLAELPLSDYVQHVYEATIKDTPVLAGENATEARRRELAYLNQRWFMMTLLTRMDRTSMHTGLEARVPFADHRIVEYVWNVPWEMKCHNGIAKGLLRSASEGHLPHEVLYRKKSPYPKTYNPSYEQQLGRALLEVLDDSHAPLRQLVSREKTESFLASPSDYGKPWYGQLMAGPQMLAYMLQVNYWLESYHITIV